MDTYLYLLLYPESLVVSMLGPSEFGTYLATGTQKRVREQAIFFQLDNKFESDYFDLAKARKACVPHEDGQPKHSVYVSTYRVLEHIPLDAIGDQWLITRDGRPLQLKRAQAPADFKGKYHLYQELCPVHPLIASTLNPLDFGAFIADPSVPVSVPRICFVELDLAGLADDPAGGDSANLPYHNVQHIRDCLMELGDTSKITKTVNRIEQEQIPYRCVKSGFFIADQKSLAYYAFPSQADMEDKYHDWWRSATL
ncbi:MAG: hypothetical protein P8Z79_09635 [Sedimentisphaerales bacterium]|jgi:hypothetical protein